MFHFLFYKKHTCIAYEEFFNFYASRQHSAIKNHNESSLFPYKFSSIKQYLLDNKHILNIKCRTTNTFGKELIQKIKSLHNMKFLSCIYVAVYVLLLYYSYHFVFFCVSLKSMFSLVCKIFMIKNPNKKYIRFLKSFKKI